ncbi:MAG TPA: glycoside hydrolase family 28 protein [Melioribacteraceae bacterium]|nr:glycoside hydrolase family 28 protein [Melioribacteraceae bacterium]
MKFYSDYLKYLLFILLIANMIPQQQISAQTKSSHDFGNVFNIMDYGAVCDGKTKITDNIKNAVDAASDKGGGTIYFPAGEYLTGPIHFKDNITIYLEAGAILNFTDDYDDYLPFVKTRWEETVCMNFSPQFYGYRVNNVAIRGRGTINGHGKKWWDEVAIYRNAAKKGENVELGKYQKLTQQLNVETKKPDTDNWTKIFFLRPPMFQVFEGNNILIEGVTIMNPPFWTLNPAFCENVTITGITINNPPESPNTDGINPSSCSYVHISNSHLSVGDDCITIKSGRDEDGRDWGKACQNITITNCTMLEGHGGVVIGSEMSGDVRKVTISNCVFDGTERGIRLKTMRGRGGIVEEIRVDGIVMKNIQREAIHINMEYKKSDAEPVSEKTPKFRNIHFSNITATDVKEAGNLLGIDEMWIEDVTFNDVNIHAETGFNVNKARNIEFHNVTVNVKKGPVIRADKVENLELEGIKTLKPANGQSLIDLKNVNNAYIYNCNPLPGTDKFLSVDGKDSKYIVVGSNNLIHVKTPITEGKELQKGSVIK